MRYFSLFCYWMLLLPLNFINNLDDDKILYPAIQPDQLRICSPIATDSVPELPKIISDPYHPPPMGQDRRHQGVDFAFYRHKGYASILGVPVQSILPGRIAAAIPNSFPFGNLIIVETPYDQLPNQVIQELAISNRESLYILYAHLQEKPEIQIGEKTIPCQKLGAAGKSGNAGAAHLHLEMRIGPQAKIFSSMSYYQLGISAEARLNYKLWRTSGIFRHIDPMKLLSPDLIH